MAKNAVLFDHCAHYDYPQLDVSCTCKYCADWREKRRSFDHAKALTSDHSISCYCWRCVARRDLQTSYLAALNKRDIYCEISWHASKHKDSYGPTLMQWIDVVLQSDELGEGWWYTRAPYFPLRHFLYRFQAVFSTKIPAVSGMFSDDKIAA